MQSNIRALSLKQPWCDAVLFASKRIENRTRWKNSNFRGPFLIHASKSCSRAYYDEVLRFLDERRIEWRPKPFKELVLGGIVGAGNVSGVVLPVPLVAGGARVIGPPSAAAQFALQRDRWWMGSFALLLDHVAPTPFVAYPGALGFFRIRDEVVREIVDRLLDHPPGGSDFGF